MNPAVILRHFWNKGRRLENYRQFHSVIHHYPDIQARYAAFRQAEKDLEEALERACAQESTIPQ